MGKGQLGFIWGRGQLGFIWGRGYLGCVWEGGGWVILGFFGNGLFWERGYFGCIWKRVLVCARLGIRLRFCVEVEDDVHVCFEVGVYLVCVWGRRSNPHGRNAQR